MKLKKCPFCGGKAQDYEVTKYPEGIGKRYSVVCTKCGAGISTIFQDKWRAIDKWNERVEVRDDPV